MKLLAGSPEQEYAGSEIVTKTVTVHRVKKRPANREIS